MIANALDERDLRRLAGCLPTCTVDVARQELSRAHRVRHNTVRLSRATDVDDALIAGMLPGDLANLHTVLGAWLAQHHRGVADNPFSYELGPGQVVIIHEADE
jgi:hypothetical protein